MPQRMMISAAVAAVVVGALLLVPSAMAQLGDGDSTPAAHSSSASAPASPSSSPSPSPRPPALAVRPVAAPVGGFLSWALLDRSTGKIGGSANIAASSSTESMIKVWIVADYLRRVDAKGVPPSKERLVQASVAIRDSDDNAAQSLYLAGGRDAVVERMIKMCGLTDSRVYPGWWSRTRISARDAVRMGNCIASGKAAGPKWTKWVLAEMAKVRGTTAPEDQQAESGGGRWGIIDGLPKEIVVRGVSIKNGWTLVGADGMWHVNCLAITADQVLAVLTRYPGSKGLRYGADLCKSVTRQLVAPGS